MYLSDIRFLLRPQRAFAEKHAVDSLVDTRDLLFVHLSFRLLEQVSEFRNAEFVGKLFLVLLFLVFFLFFGLFGLFFPLFRILGRRSFDRFGGRRFFLFFLFFFDLFFLFFDLLFGHIGLVEEERVLDLSVDKPFHKRIADEHHISDGCLNALVHIHLFAYVFDRKAHFRIAFYKLPQYESLFEIGVFKYYVGSRDRRTDGRAVYHLLCERRR